MPEKIEKRTPTREDVLAPRIWTAWPGFKTRRQVALGIVVGAWSIPEVYDAGTASRYIKLPALDSLLDKMVKDGSLVRMNGWGLEKLLTDWSSVTRTWNYYMLPDKAQELRDAADARESEALQKQADTYAKVRLAERYREEYGALVAKFHASMEEGQ
ncbi:hypothetical protein [Streptomyces sp. NPDC088752]|uniref:hypothetical protein n=1 Tax=Streptomyces sp. NPDC088752 TaxID=3154963 RepID=UPI0034426832